MHGMEFQIDSIDVDIAVVVVVVVVVVEGKK